MIHDVTTVACGQAEFVMTRNGVFEGRVRHVIPAERALDIDTPLDLDCGMPTGYVNRESQVTTVAMLMSLRAGGP